MQIKSLHSFTGRLSSSSAELERLKNLERRQKGTGCGSGRKIYSILSNGSGPRNTFQKLILRSVLRLCEVLKLSVAKFQFFSRVVRGYVELRKIEKNANINIFRLESNPS